MKKLPLFLFKIMPVRTLSEQARKPSGFLGRFLMGPLFIKGNAGLNDLLFDTLDPAENDVILEIGFGPGALIRKMADALPVGQIEGIDISDAMIREATGRNQKYIRRGRVRLQKGDSRSLPYGNGYFDKICSANTIYFWDQPDQYLREIYRVLKPGGKALIGFRSRDQMESLPLSSEVFNTYTADEVIQLISGAGFSNVRLIQREDAPFISHCAIGFKSASG